MVVAITSEPSFAVLSEILHAVTPPDPSDRAEIVLQANRSTRSSAHARGGGWVKPKSMSICPVALVDHLRVHTCNRCKKTSYNIEFFEYDEDAPHQLVDTHGRGPNKPVYLSSDLIRDAARRYQEDTSQTAETISRFQKMHYYIFDNVSIIDCAERGIQKFRTDLAWDLNFKSFALLEQHNGRIGNLETGQQDLERRLDYLETLFAPSQQALRGPP